MLSKAKHPYWIDLTLSAGADIPLLVEGEGQQGEVCHPQLVMLSEAKHPYWIDLTLFRRCRNVPLLVEGEGPEGEVAILNLSC